jgi:hypothetical protein
MGRRYADLGCNPRRARAPINVLSFCSALQRLLDQARGKP